MSRLIPLALIHSAEFTAEEMGDYLRPAFGVKNHIRLHGQLLQPWPRRLLSFDTDSYIGKFLAKISYASEDNIRDSALPSQQTHETANWPNTHFEMKPVRPRTQVICDFCELLNGHLRKFIVIDNSPTPGGLAFNNVARGRLAEVLSVDTVIQFDTRLKPGLDLLGCNRRSGGEDCNQVQRRRRVVCCQLL